MPRRIFSIFDLQKFLAAQSLPRKFLASALSGLLAVGGVYLNIQLQNVFRNEIFFLLFLPLIYFVSHYWGLMPGLVCLSVTILGSLYLLILSPLPFESNIEIIRLTVFLGTALLVVYGNQLRLRLSQSLARELLENSRNQSRLETLSKISEKSHDLIIVCDQDGKISYLNQHIRERLFGFDPLPASLFLSDIFDPVINQEISTLKLMPKNLIDFQVTTGNLKPISYLRIIPVRINVLEVGSDSAVQPQYALICYDQSTEMELRRRVKVAKGYIPMGLWSVDTTREKLDLDSNASDILGVQDVTDWTWDRFISFIDGEFRPEIERLMASIESAKIGSEFDMVLKIRTPQGIVRWINFLGAVFKSPSGKVVQIDGMLLNISALKESEEHLRDAVRLRDHFFAIASHELKTPITSLNLQLEVLKECLDSAISPQNNLRSECFEIIEECKQQYDRLARLVNDFMDVARISNGKLSLRFSRIDLKQLVDSTAKLFSVSSQVHVVHPPSEQSLPFTADQERLCQVLINLINNAVKFGERKPIEVSYETADASVVLRVKDHGVGIGQSDLKRIFNEFEQASTGTDKQHGLGLGLYITREIVRAHGGKVKVTSKLGEGSIFEVNIPRLELAFVQTSQEG